MKRETKTKLNRRSIRPVNSVREAQLDAVGIGVPSVVEFETGRVVSSVNVPLAEIPLRQVLGEHLGARLQHAKTRVLRDF